MPLEARVKSVLSGDTVVLSHITNPGQERILSLAYVSAPRLRREGDEVSFYFLIICLFWRFDGLLLVAGCGLDRWPLLGVTNQQYPNKLVFYMIANSD